MDTKATKGLAIGVAVLVVLAVGAAVLASLRPAPELPAGSPEARVRDYVTALYERDPGRAVGHLDPDGPCVEGDLRELFAWTIREGVTNVVRHSKAAHCEIELSAERVVIRNDGADTGDAPGDLTPDHTGEGHGLRGLRERADAVGAHVSAGRHGAEFTLEVGA